MKTIQKRVLPLALACILVLGAFAGCSQQKPDATAGTPAGTNSASNPTEVNTDPYHITDEHVVYNVACGSIANWGDLNNKPAQLALEEKTNVDLVFDVYLRDVANERVSILMASDPLPDCFWGNNNFMPRTLVNEYGKQGLLIDLKPLIREHAPHIAAVYDKFDVWGNYDDGEGHMYSLASITDNGRPVSIYDSLFINTKYLEQVGLDMPTTNEEYFEALKAIKGLKTPEGREIYPFSWGPVDGFGSQLKCNFGIHNVGMCWMRFDGKKLYRQADSENYKQWLKFMNKLWENELIDPEVYTQDQTTYRAKCGAGQVASFSSFGGWWEVGMENIENNLYENVPPFPGPDGTKLAVNVEPNSQNRNECDFAITKDCKDPVTLIKYVDLFYNDDLLVAYEQACGQRGVTWDYNKDGMIETFEVPKEYKSWGEWRCSQVVPPNPNSWGPKLNAKLLPNHTEIVKAENEKAAGYFEAAKNDHPLPLLNFTSEESEELADLRLDIEEYLKVFEAECITGKRDIDAVWSDHTAQLNKMQYERVLEIYNDALARRLASK